jgi:hypothetical protein
MRQEEDAYRILGGKSEEKNRFGNLGVDEKQY